MEHKTYPLLPIDNGYVAVDKEETNYDKVGWWIYMNRFLGGTCVFDENRISFKDSEGGIHTLYKDKDDHKYLYRVIAHTGIPSLLNSGLPLMEILDPIWKKAWDIAYQTGIKDEQQLVYIATAWYDGYKAAGFTEEDMRNAFYQGREVARLDDHKRIVFKNPTFEGYLRDVKKHPKAVVLEMEKKVNTDIKHVPSLYIYEPKVVEGKVIVKKVIYE